MSGFPALNIEPEDDSAEEIDDTREIQLEEGLKLYQNALRLHSLGPEYLGQAADAYKDLFQSEIFRYPEAVSEFARDELDNGPEETLIAEQNVSQLSTLPPTNAQASPSSLPQIIYLSFKNYGQFLLEHYAQTNRTNEPADRLHHSAAHEAILVCSTALKQFGEALERDDTDLDLWRKAARVAQICISGRIVRFCLESVLAEDDEGSNEVVEILGLDEALAAGQLKEIIDTLQDDLSRAQQSGREPRRDLLRLLKKTIDPFPFLPSAFDTSGIRFLERKPLSCDRKRCLVRTTSRSWLGIGQALLQSLNNEQQFESDVGPGAGAHIDVPAELDSRETGEPFDEPSHAAAEPKSHRSATRISSLEVVQMTNGAAEAPIEADHPIFNAEEAKQTCGRSPVDEAADAMLSPSQAEAMQTRTDEVCKGEVPDGAGGDAPIPTRKRSAGYAGHDETADNGRLKSKRLRNRESNADAMLQEEDAANTTARYYEDQLKDLAFADQRLFKMTSNLLSKFGIDQPGSAEDLRQQVLSASAIDDTPGQEVSVDVRATIDLRSVLISWSDEKANAMIYGYGGSQFGGGKAGLTLFLEHSKTAMPKSYSVLPFSLGKELSHFVSRCNDGWYSPHQVAIDWLQNLIRPTISSDSGDAGDNIRPSSYTSTVWPEALKLTIVQLIVREDDYIYQFMQQRLEELAERMLPIGEFPEGGYTLEDVASTDMAQTLYELHLDIYSRITNPSSQVDKATRSLQHDRLNRWSELAGSFTNIYADHANDVPIQQWNVIRFIWTATVHANMADDASQEHVMLCLQDLQALLSHAGNPTIILPNNAALPEISVTAVEQEISRISTLDFFMSIFNDDSSDSIAVIESLEPILEPFIQSTPLSPAGEEDAESIPPVSAQTVQLIEFLESGDASLKLFLWRRLRDAYIAIDYSPKVVSCYLRSIEAIMSELSSQRHLRLPSESRQIALLKWTKELDDVLSKMLQKILADPKAFEIVDHRHLQGAMSTIGRLSRILHGVALYEDAVRVGQLTEPKGKNVSGTKSLDKFRDRLRDMHVRAWTIQYTLLKEAIAQHTSQLESPHDDQAGYLRSLHNSLGLRGYCKHSNKIFLRLLKSELMTMDTKEDYSAEMAQVLFDLHQLKFATGIGDLDHDCPPEQLDKKSAAHILETVVLQARRMNIKDLLKSELKNTIEKIQQALGAPKSASVLSYNRRTINAYLKSPINQLQLFRASRGEGGLPVREVETESAKIAAHGWYFLLGHLALAKFKSAKRTNPGPTDDLDIAISFFKQDLEHNIEKWETWLRLAQAYDAKIEEDLLWTAEKVNNHRPDLAMLQRNAIHSYEMAMAMSLRSSDDASQSANKMSEMYTGFATRLYASSREPLSMDAFDNTYHQRHYSHSSEQSNLYQGPSTPSMPLFAVWRFSAHLLRRALSERPQNWMNHYLLGKCLWKMLTHPQADSRRKVHIEEVLDAFSEAIECLPERKDSRADHILEPHFKLVSVVHKLVHRNMLTPLQGSDALQATTWAHNIHLAEDEDSWEPYVLEILKKIGHADKSNWHHRIIARAAHVIYDDQQDIGGALGAKHEFTQQVFTKTMTLQVWKPEYERAGRHFVYTTRYVLFFVSLLNQLNDRTSMDQLVRRIRRKPGDYLNHQLVWEQVITSYVGLLRRVAKVPIGLEEALFRTMDHDDFLTNAGKLEIYAHDPETSNTVLDVLRDAIELKKLNNSLMKGAVIDDLVVDCYALLYQSFVATLPAEEKAESNLRSEGKTVELEPIPDGVNRERMKLGNILTAQADGNAESPGPSLTPKPQQIPAVSAMPAPPPKPTRPKIVTRREVQRKAEGLIVRPPPIKTPTLLKHTSFPRPSVTVEIPLSSNKHGRSSSTADMQPVPVGLGLGPVEGSRIASLVREEAEDGTGSADSSRPGSVHDSADDESELSELEEVENALDENVEESREGETRITFRPAALFPALRTKSQDGANDDSSVVISDSGSAPNEHPDGMDHTENFERLGNEGTASVRNAAVGDVMEE
jgi:hypothetical protein